MPDAIAYKLFRLKNGRLYPLYVRTNVPVPIGVWLEAREGERLPNGKVKAKLGQGLKFRPGWHLSDVPTATHIGVKENGKIVCRHPCQVWCEVEYHTENNYTAKALARGLNPITHNVVRKDCDLDYIPKNGFYRYKTSPNMLGEWIIAGEMRVRRVLTEDEVKAICKEHEIIPQPSFTEYMFRTEKGA